MMIPCIVHVFFLACWKEDCLEGPLPIVMAGSAPSLREPEKEKKSSLLGIMIPDRQLGKQRGYKRPFL